MRFGSLSETSCRICVTVVVAFGLSGRAVGSRHTAEVLAALVAFRVAVVDDPNEDPMKTPTIGTR